MNSSNKNQIRREVRNRRKQLSAQQQQDAASTLAKKVLNCVLHHGAKRVALFLSIDGEIPTNKTIASLWQNGIEVFIPLIHPFNPKYLLFIRYAPDSLLTRNPLGMLEPKPNCNHVCPLTQLDILFTPLVAFDNTGHRLGMGGGFYDRTLACHFNQKRTKPQIIGVAHDCQQVDSVPTQSWDIPLSALLTPTKNFYWSNT
jgi:5-formyltetrahydrofolate cyclo-ligase